MKFTKIRLTGLYTIDLPIVNAHPSDMYILKNADGLGPPEVDVSIVDALNSGGYYQGRRTNLREIVLHIGLNPDYITNQSVADLRNSLYGTLTPGLADNVRVDIMLEDTSLVYTSGYVKKMEIAPFSQTPEVQVTISCVDKYWKTNNFLYLIDLNKVTPTINNVGTAPSGFHMEVIMTAAQTWWTISNDGGKSRFRVDYNFQVGDKLIFDTRPGFREVKLERTTVVSNIIYALSADSTWYLLHGGENIFNTTFQTFEWGSVFYHPQYWGI
jgi:hypothetical protein